MEVERVSEVFANKAKKKAYLSDKMVTLINELIAAEFNAQQLYKSMATWAEFTGYDGLASFMNKHTSDENMHMNKLYQYMLDRQVNPITPMVKQQPIAYKDLKDVIERGLVHEELIEDNYKKAVKLALAEPDHSTYTLFQWFLNEQVEEIKLFSGILDRLHVVGCDQKGMYFIDQELKELA